MILASSSLGESDAAGKTGRGEGPDFILAIFSYIQCL